MKQAWWNTDSCWSRVISTWVFIVLHSFWEKSNGSKYACINNNALKGEWGTCFNLFFSQCIILHLVKCTHFLNIERKKNEICRTKAIILLNIGTFLFIVALCNKINKSVTYGTCEDIEMVTSMGTLCKAVYHNGCLTQVSMLIKWVEIKSKMKCRVAFH